MFDPDLLYVSIVLIFSLKSCGLLHKSKVLHFPKKIPTNFQIHYVIQKVPEPDDINQLSPREQLE